MVDLYKVATHLTIDEGTGPVKNNRYFPYTDTVGKVTIGTGRNLTDRGISEDECALMLQNDITDAYNAAKLYPWFEHLDDARQGVVVMMIFNLGPERFAGFKNTIAMLAAGNYSGAAYNMALSHWHEQVGYRAEVYERIMLTGEWQ